jgi:tight adherence protein C
VLIILLGALAFAGISATLIARAVAMPRTRTAQNIQQIAAYGYGAEAAAQAAAPRGLFDELAGMVGGALASHVSGMREEDIRLRLMAAGMYSMPPRRFIGYRVIAAAMAPITFVWAGLAVGAAPFVTLLAGICGALVGWRIPMVVVDRRIRAREQQVEYALPELIDLLVVTVEAGLGFNGSLHIAATRIEGPLGDELRLALQEQSMGLSTQDALRNMLARCETPSMRSFVRSVLQGEVLGVSIGQIMRNLALEMRKQRRSHAEERAQKAPIKILFPLIFLIFPAMFIVLLGPAVLTLMDAFGNR